ncbi:hypothetical protein QJS10_CPA03g01133 [Acorus calamus]|uniref:Aminotransferase-like plant mobile domain-containing protein n=1 Tax=Acorus calamus TaxID=4465 RepID=A0AAV9F3C8_ACOCL|nr:hypothetical protein QJS10_CPA03g01133 [Acorus calamus]
MRVILLRRALTATDPAQNHIDCSEASRHIMARPDKLTPRRSPRNRKPSIVEGPSTIRKTRTAMDGMSVRPCHRRLMKKTPFNILINIPKMQFQSELLDVIVSSYNEDGDFFELGGQPIYLTAEDIALIIGLPAFGETPKLDSSATESKIKSRFFSNNSMITRGVLKDKMSSLVDSDNPRDIKDFVRLWIAFIFACFLFPIGHYNCPMPLLTILDDLNSTCNYAWFVAIRNQIMEGVRKQRVCIAERNEGQYPKSSMGYVFGCTAVLCVSIS